MEDQQTQTTDSSEQVVEAVESNEGVVDSNVDDTSFDELFAEEGTEDVAGKGEVENLSLEELNKILKREFKSKDEALKNIEGLHKLVGDQKLAKERKAKAPEQESEVAILRKELAAEKFYSSNPTAKSYTKIIEAYAKDNGMTLSEAWESDDFKPFSESSQKRQPIVTNNRLNPASPRVPLDLINEAKQGSDKAQLDVVNKWFTGKK